MKNFINDLVERENTMPKQELKELPEPEQKKKEDNTMKSKKNPQKVQKARKPRTDVKVPCQFCGEEKSKSGLPMHELHCKKNPKNISKPKKEPVKTPSTGSKSNPDELYKTRAKDVTKKEEKPVISQPEQPKKQSMGQDFFDVMSGGK